MVDFGKDYGSSLDAGVPRVTKGMLIHAIRVVFGMARDADDARFLAEVLGFPSDALEEARSR